MVPAGTEQNHPAEVPDGLPQDQEKEVFMERGTIIFTLASPSILIVGHDSQNALLRYFHV